MSSGSATIWNPFPPKPPSVPKASTPEPPPTIREVVAPTPPEALQIPNSTPGMPIPYVCGRVKIGQSQIVWAGVPLLKTLSQQVYQEFNDGNLDNTLETFTFKIYKVNPLGSILSLQLGLCLGPDVTLRKIYGKNDQVLWEGTAGPARTEFTITDVSTFVSGPLIFQGGNFTQTQEEYLLNNIDESSLPAYPGLAYLIVKSAVITELDAELGFEVSRYPNVLGLSGAVLRSGGGTGDDINPAAMLADYLSTDWGGLGLGIGAIDTASFTAAATTLAAEGNWASIQIANDIAGGDIVTTILDQMAATLVEDPATGTIKLFLDRYSGSTVVTKSLTEKNVKTVTRGQRRSSDTSAVDKLTMGFTNRAKDYAVDTAVASVQRKASIGIEQVVDYPLVHTAEVAEVVLKREFTRSNSTTYALEVEGDRSLASLLPGDVVRIHLPTQGIEPMVCTVVKTRRQPLDVNTVVLTLLQLHNTDSELDVNVDNEGEDLPTNAPTAPVTAMVREAPFWIARMTGAFGMYLNSLVVDKLAIMCLPKPNDRLQSSWMGYIYDLPQNPGDLSSFTAFDAQYPVTGNLVGAISKRDAIDDGILTSVTIDNVIDPYNLLISQGATGLLNGVLLMFIGDEILGHITATDNEDGSWTFTTVHRGLIDTVPCDHADGAQVYIVHNGAWALGCVSYTFPFTASDTQEVRLIGHTLFERGDVEIDYTDFFIETGTVSRFRRPHRPVNMKIDGADRSESLLNIFGGEGIVLEPGQSIAVTYNSRSRYLFGIVTQLSGSQHGEETADDVWQYHRCIIRDSGGTERNCGQTSNTVSLDDDIAGTVHPDTAIGAGVIFVQAKTNLGDSLYEDSLPVVIITDYFVDETGAFSFITEDGAAFFIS